MIKFKTAGWRGIIGEDFNFKNVKLCAQAISEYLKLKNFSEVIVGYDGRYLSREFAKNLTKVLTANRIKVYLTKESTPTPVISFWANKKRIYAVVITASHNPPCYNGIEIISPFGYPLEKEETDEIEKILKDIKKSSEISLLQAKRKGFLEEFEPSNFYIAHLKNLINLKNKNIKVLINPMNGVAGKYFLRILKNKFFKLVNFEEKPDFNGKIPDPTMKENLYDVLEILKKEDFDFCISLDGDGDRVSVLLKNGEYIDISVLSALILKYLMNKKNYTQDIARSVATSDFIDKVATFFKKKVIETPVGFKYIGKLLYKKKIMLGCEESGGIGIINHIPNKDGILTALLIIKIAEEGNLFEKIREIEETFGKVFYEKLSIPINLDLFKNFEKYFLDLKIKKVFDFDGKKIIFDNGNWILIRKSGTENLLRIYIEAKTKEDLDRLKSKFSQ